MFYHTPRYVTDIVSVHGQLSTASIPLSRGGENDTIDTRLEAFYRENSVHSRRDSIEPWHYRHHPIEPKHGDGVVYCTVEYNVRRLTRFFCCHAHGWVVRENAEAECRFRDDPGYQRPSRLEMEYS